jgi:hypothetical protein
MTDMERRFQLGDTLQPMIVQLDKGNKSENGQAMTIAQKTLYAKSWTR